MKRAFTMVEILVAVTLSLLLLLGVTEMFRRVGTMIDDTTSTQNMTSTMNEVSLVLRNDLGGIDPNLASQPSRMSESGYTGDGDGYLEITEGMNAPYSLVNTNGGLHAPMSRIALNPDTATASPDLTVGDVDDVLAFTAKASGAQFRGLINGQLQKSNTAQIIWFVRGTTLYRRLLLIDEYEQCTTLGDNAQNDVSFYYDGTTPKAAKSSDLKFRQNRFAHPAAQVSAGNLPTNFPMPAHDASRITWFLLRMPTLEEQIQYPALVSSTGLTSLGNTVEYNGTALPSPFASPPAPYQDFWQNPNAFKFTGGGNTWLLDSKTGSLYQDGTPYSDGLRHPRAGDDIVLTNVLSFDVKVWNPYWVPCLCADGTTFYAAPQFIDLGQDVLRDINGNEGRVIYTDKLDGTTGNVAITGIPEQRGYGFTLKGRYSAAPTAAQRWLVDPSSPSSVLDDWQKKEVIRTTAPTSTATGLSRWGADTNRLPMPCVFDSWTKAYAEEESGYTNFCYGFWDENGDGTVTAGEKQEILNWKAPPPYSEKLEAIQITIRCFDPRSRQIKQVQVVHRFD